MTFPFHPKTTIQILHTVFFIFSYGTDKENLFDNQELHKTGYHFLYSRRLFIWFLLVITWFRVQFGMINQTLKTSRKNNWAFVLFLCLVSVDSSNHHTKVITIVTHPVFLNKLLRETPPEIYSGSLVHNVISVLELEFLASWFSFVKCFCFTHSPSNSEFNHCFFLLTCPPFCFGVLSRLTCQSI